MPFEGFEYNVNGRTTAFGQKGCASAGRTAERPSGRSRTANRRRELFT